MDAFDTFDPDLLDGGDSFTPIFWMQMEKDRANYLLKCARIVEMDDISIDEDVKKVKRIQDDIMDPEWGHEYEVDILPGNVAVFRISSIDRSPLWELYDFKYGNKKLMI